MQAHGVICVGGGNTPHESDIRGEMRKPGYCGLVEFVI
jgi:hypothetical protein